MLGFIIARETVNARLDQDQAELRVLVLAVGLQVLSHGNCLLDQVPEVLRDLGCKTCPTNVRPVRTDNRTKSRRRRTLGLEDTEDFVTRDKTHLRDAVRVTEGNTDLRWCKTLARELDYLLDNIVWRCF